MQLPPGKVRRLLFIVSGITDALIGAGLLLLGLGVTPVQVGQDGTHWTFVLLGVVMFVTGVGVAIYNFSRFEE